MTLNICCLNLCLETPAVRAILLAAPVYASAMVLGIIRRKLTFGRLLTDSLEKWMSCGFLYMSVLEPKGFLKSAFLYFCMLSILVVQFTQLESAMMVQKEGPALGFLVENRLFRCHECHFSLLCTNLRSLFCFCTTMKRQFVTFVWIAWCTKILYCLKSWLILCLQIFSL